MGNKDQRIGFQDFIDTLLQIQDVMNKENEERILNSPDEDWDLLLSLEVTPSSFVIKSEYTIMEFDDKLNPKNARVRKRRKR
tara:strand:+ start:4105 stop:4350 length:246 start_codon:yes stop_codon:yes gene_type:complete